MLPYFITFTILTLIIVGVITYFSTHYFDFKKEKPYVFIPPVIVLVASLTLGGGIFLAITNSSIKNQLTYNEMWNGFETEATKKTITCRKDGSCSHTYSCDPEQRLVTKYRSVSDGKGGTKTESYQTTETVWHQCPYSKEETSYFVLTNLPNTKISYGRNLMTGDPWRWGTSIPGGQKSDPQPWLDAKNRIDSGKPEGLTEKHTYENPIHATENTYKRDKTLVENYLSEGLLPAIQTEINAGRNSKFYPVQISGISHNYQQDVANLNGVMAADKKFGDLRVVMVDSKKIDNQYDYTNALAAYWGSSEHFEKWALPKNSLTVVIGVEQSTNTVSWADSFTGMPIGNEAFMQSVKSLSGKKIDENLLGRPVVLKNKQVVRTNGELEKIIWSDTTGFQRVSMSGDDNEASGFKYLSTDIQPTNFAKVWGIILWSLIMLGSGAGAFVYIFKNGSSFSRRSSMDY